MFVRSPEQVIRELRDFGFDLFVGEDGAVHGRFREKGKRMTLEMRAVVDEMQSMNDQVAAILRSESESAPEGRQEFTGITVEHALAIGEKVNAGLVELDGKVTYHQSTGMCDLAVKGVKEG